MSPIDWKTLIKIRMVAKKSIESYLENHGFYAVEAPILVIAPGTEVHLQYFATEWQDHQNRLHQLYLRSSPELHLKQALAQGLERIYHMGPAFRNHGELSQWHYPEFMMLEWYQAGISYHEFMAQTEDLIRCVHRDLKASFPNWTRPEIPTFKKISVFEAFESFAGINLIDQDSELAAKGIAQGYLSINESDDFETAFFKILLDVIEPRLNELKAVYLFDYPSSQAALAKVEHHRARRFELYLAGIEICNAFEELLDSHENEKRLVASNKLRKTLGHREIPIDPGFTAAMRRGIPPCCGNAMGFDRLLAYLLNRSSIQDILPFAMRLPFHSDYRSSLEMNSH
jgi:lysyl-tRNA synthetase class 2